MQYTVIPASSQACTAAIRTLLAHESAPVVVGISRNDAKIPHDVRSNKDFKFVKGNLNQPETIDFSGSAGVLVTTPASFVEQDTTTYTKRIATNIANAVAKSGSVQRLVYISSIGAQHSSDVGEVRSNHESETILQQAAPEVIFVRNAYFMDNWIPAIQTSRADHPFFYSCITPVDFKMPMVASRDVGRTCAMQLLKTESGLLATPQIIKLQGPEWYSTEDVQRVIESLSGNQVEIKSVPRDGLAGFFSAVLPPHLVEDFVGMTLAWLPGGFWSRKRGPYTPTTAFSMDLFPSRIS